MPIVAKMTAPTYKLCHKILRRGFASFVEVMKRFVVVLVLLCHAVPFTFASAADVANTDGGSGSGRELHVLLITSSSPRFDSSGAETAVRLALDRVNANDFILPGYELQLAGVRDTKVVLFTVIILFLERHFLVCILLEAVPSDNN